MTPDGKDRVVVDTGIIMAVIAYRSKSLVPVFDKANNIKERREKIKEAKAANPRKIELVCLKNRYGVANFSCYFDYYPANDLFQPCSDAELDFSPTVPQRKAGRKL